VEKSEKDLYLGLKCNQYRAEGPFTLMQQPLRVAAQTTLQ